MKTITVYPIGERSQFGRNYVAVCDGIVIAQHFCSSDDFAKQDLGVEPPERCGSDSKHFSVVRREYYANLFPEGFKVEFSTAIFTQQTKDTTFFASKDPSLWSLEDCQKILANAGLVQGRPDNKMLKIIEYATLNFNLESSQLILLGKVCDACYKEGVLDVLSHIKGS